MGLVRAAEGLGSLVFDVPAGVAIRRFGHRMPMLVGGVVIVASSLAMAWARSLPEALAYRLVSGMGMALWNISRHTYVAETVRIQRRGRTNAVMGGIGRIAGFVGPAIGGLLAKAFELTTPFYATAALSLLGLLAVARWVTVGQDVQARAAQGQHADSVLHILRDHWRVLVSAGSGQLCAQLVRSARNAVVPLYAAQVLGLEAASVGLIISLSYGADMMMFMPAGYIMDRHGRKYAYVPSFLIQSGAMALVPLTGGFLSLAAVTMALGLGNGLGSGTMLTLGADLAPERGRGDFLGLWRFIGDGGSAAGPMIVGQVAQLAGLGAAPIAIAGVGVLGAVLLGTLVPETLKRE